MTLTAIREAQERWYDGGLDLLRACVDGEAIGSAQTLYVSAMGLPRAELRDGIDLLVRAAPSLDPTRSRAALAALGGLTGFQSSNDPTRALDWWLAEGSLLDEGELWERTGRDDGALRGGLKMGELTLDPP